MTEEDVIDVMVKFLKVDPHWEDKLQNDDFRGIAYDLYDYLKKHGVQLDD